MPTSIVLSLIFGCLLAAVLAGQSLSPRLSAAHLTPETRDTVKLSLGLVATMTALLLGLLVSSAKGGYDDQRRQVDQLAAKVATLDRVLVLYGPETAAARQELKAIVEHAIDRAWPEARGARSSLAPDVRSGDALYREVENLTPSGASQSALKDKAAGFTLELAEARALLVSRALERVSMPLVAVVGAWLVLILFGFSTLAPVNAIAKVALLSAAAAVGAAMLLLLEYYGHFTGLIRLSSDALSAAIGQIPS